MNNRAGFPNPHRLGHSACEAARLSLHNGGQQSADYCIDSLGSPMHGQVSLTAAIYLMQKG
jgi:hypothetical protein